MNNTDLFTRMKTMETAELLAYYKSASIIGRLSNIAGIGSIVYLLCAPFALFSIVACMLTYVSLNMSVSSDSAKAYIKSLIDSRPPEINS